MKTKELLSQENIFIDIPGLNRFRVGDHVVADACADHDRFQGVVIGVELQRSLGGYSLTPSITLLHDGNQITDGFKPGDLRPDGE